MLTATTLVDGLHFGEGPRWHEGRLWFSDFYDHAVKSADDSGSVRIEHQLDDQPSGLGWLPNGQLLVVSMRALKVLKEDNGQLIMHADLSAFATHLCNDMVVDRAGRAFVGNFGFDLDEHLATRGPEAVMADHPTTNLVRVDTDGSAQVAADEMHFPNGSVISEDGETLIVAETLAMRLSAFDIDATGQLSNRRVWAELGAFAPDGICLDSNNNVWVANALAAECVLFAEGGERLSTVQTSQNCYACMLGGDDGRTLFMMTAQDSNHAVASAKRTGKIETVLVDAPATGYP